MDNKSKFVEWMRKISNIYYADQERMSSALEKIQENPCELNEDYLDS